MLDAPAILSDEQIADLRKTALADLFAFARIVLGLDYLEMSLHYPLCEFLARRPKRGVVVLPRSFLKTSIVRAYVIWRACHNPNIRVLYVTNTEPNAKKFIHAIKDVFERNRLFGILFPELLPDFSHGRWSDLQAEVTRDAVGLPEATFEGVGVGSAVVSRHYDLIIEDDTLAPHKDDVHGEEIMPMKDEIDKIVGWHKLATPLLVDPRTSERLVTATRWTYDDVIHHVLQQNVALSIGDDMRWQLFERAIVDEAKRPTYPKRFDEKVIDSLRLEMGPYLFSALYMNKPITGDKQAFKLPWVQNGYYLRAPDNLRKFIALDAAYSMDGRADYTAIVVGGVTEDAHLYILDYVRQRLMPKDIVESLFTLLRMHPTVERITVEAIAAQIALTYDIQDKLDAEPDLFISIDAIKSRARTKEARIARLQPLAANGRLHLRPTMTEMIDELLMFPFARHDDLVDATSDLVPYLGFRTIASPAEMPPEVRQWRQDAEGRLSIGLDEILAQVTSTRNRGMFDLQSAGSRDYGDYPFPIHEP